MCFHNFLFSFALGNIVSANPHTPPVRHFGKRNGNALAATNALSARAKIKQLTQNYTAECSKTQHPAAVANCNAPRLCGCKRIMSRKLFCCNWLRNELRKDPSRA
jgi:hypothetical protein